MEALKGTEGIASTHFWPRHQIRWVVSVTPRLRFSPGARTPSTHCTGGWVGPRTGLDTEAIGNIWARDLVKSNLFPLRLLHALLSGMGMNQGKYHPLWAMILGMIRWCSNYPWHEATEAYKERGGLPPRILMTPHKSVVSVNNRSPYLRGSSTPPPYTHRSSVQVVAKRKSQELIWTERIL
jgi:hypothetical protein